MGVDIPVNLWTVVCFLWSSLSALVMTGENQVTLLVKSINTSICSYLQECGTSSALSRCNIILYYFLTLVPVCITAKLSDVLLP